MHGRILRRRSLSAGNGIPKSVGGSPPPPTGARLRQDLCPFALGQNGHSSALWEPAGARLNGGTVADGQETVLPEQTDVLFPRLATLWLHGWKSESRDSALICLRALSRWGGASIFSL